VKPHQPSLPPSADPLPGDAKDYAMLVRQFYGRHIATNLQNGERADFRSDTQKFLFTFPAKAGIHGSVVSNFLSDPIANRQ
jgi:hypothetical protein